MDIRCNYDLNSDRFRFLLHFAIIIIIILCVFTPLWTVCFARINPLHPICKVSDATARTLLRSQCTSHIIIFYIHIVSYGRYTNRSHYVVVVGLRILLLDDKQTRTIHKNKCFFKRHFAYFMNI